MLHAHRNPIRVFELDDLVMLIGADESGRMLEIGVAAPEGIEFIVPCRSAAIPDVCAMARDQRYALVAWRALCR